MKILDCVRAGNLVFAKTKWNGKVDFAGYDFETGAVQTDRCTQYTEKEFEQYCNELIPELLPLFVGDK